MTTRRQSEGPTARRRRPAAPSAALLVAAMATGCATLRTAPEWTPAPEVAAPSIGPAIEPRSPDGGAADPAVRRVAATATDAAPTETTPALPPSASYPIDLTTALRLAEAENPRIGEARARIGEALAHQQQARALLLPMLNAGAMAQEQRKAEGLSPIEAIRKAGRMRVRPVVMTALAAFFAMIPTALALEKGSEANAPLGRAILGGLLIGTPGSLLVAPALYALLIRGDYEEPEDPEQVGGEGQGGHGGDRNDGDDAE